MAGQGRSIRWGLIFLGLILAVISAAWFLTPLKATVLDAIAGGSGGGVARTAAKGARQDTSTLDMLNTALDAANAFFGAIGLFMTLRGLRGQSQRQG